jgi:protein-S-isoprenylcysteine O-methyltransferase Ste14
VNDVTQVARRAGTFNEWVLSRRRLWAYLGNVLLACWGVVFLITMIADFNAHHRLSSLLMGAFEGSVIWFALLRPMPKASNFSLYDWSIALLGSVIPLLVRPAPHVHDYTVLLSLQLAGMVISVTGLLSLNKSFGIVAANRGVKTTGMYGLVRHPIYAGYFLSVAAYVAQNPTFFNILVYVAFVALELMRINAEERVLLMDYRYVEYSLKTRYRVVPYFY